MFKENLRSAPVTINKELEDSLIKVYGSHHEARRQLWKALTEAGVSPNTMCSKKNRLYTTFSLTELSELLETVTEKKEAA